MKIKQITLTTLSLLLILPSMAQVAPLAKCPKNYMLLFLNSAQSNMSAIFGNPDFVGIQERYLWKDLEPTQGNYDFSQIRSDINYLSPNGKHLIVAIHVNATGSTPPNVPAYIQTSTYAGGVVSGNGGTEWIAKRWNANLNARLAALYTALADTFNTNPFFDGVTFDESAASIPNCASPGDYTAVGLCNGLKQNMKDARSVFAPNKIIIQYLNNLHCLTSAQQLPLFNSIDSLGAAIGVGVGGPDVVVGNYTTAQPLQKNYDGLIPLGTALQNADYGYTNPYTGKTVTMEEVIRWGVDSLRLDYIFWLKKEPDFTNNVVPALALHRSQCIVATSSGTIPQEQSDLIVYPNPSNGAFTLKNGLSGKFEITIYNTLGEKIFQQLVFDASVPIDISDSPSGIYFMQIRSKDVFTKKIIIEK